MLMRYPGAKTKLARHIIPRLDLMLEAAGDDVEYREPFLGAGAIGLPLLGRNRQVRRAWINDRDPSAAAVWDCVTNRPTSLKYLVHAFSEILSVNYFYFYRKLLLPLCDAADLERYDVALVALMKLALHQMSYSGLGPRAGGPMGGRGQEGPYGVACRYRPDRICRTIDECHDILARIELRRGTCTSLSFEELFDPGDAIYYLDPPYYGAGPGLYQISLRHEDHGRLSGLLREESRPWLLSYDNHPAILDLYGGWARIEEVIAPYSINGHARVSELLISNRSVVGGSKLTTAPKTTRRSIASSKGS